MVDVKAALKSIARLTALKFFPVDPDGRKAILELMCSMATRNDQIDWVVSQMLAWYNEWPGPREMRGVFCQRWKPAVGPDVNCSQVFSGGVFPGCEASAPPRMAISPTEARELLQNAWVDAEYPKAPKRPTVAPAVKTTARLITQADFDLAVRAVRDAKSRGELEGK